MEHESAARGGKKVQRTTTAILTLSEALCLVTVGAPPIDASLESRSEGEPLGCPGFGLSSGLASSSFAVEKRCRCAVSERRSRQAPGRRAGDRGRRCP